MHPDSSNTTLTLPRRTLGTTGLQVSPVAIDGSVFGWAAGHDETATVLDAYRAAGGNYICTADHYAGGRSEIMIGHWLSTRGARGEMLISTKIGRHPDALGLSAYSILAAVDACLERLGVDHIDVLALDQDHPETPIDETLGALDRVISAGKVRYVAESGLSAARVLEFDEVAKQQSLPRIDVIIAEYSLMERAIYESELAPLAVERGGAAVARMPLASGFLTGRYRSRQQLPESVMFGNAIHYVGRRGKRVLDALDRVSSEVDEPLASVALAWLLARPGVATAALRAKEPAHLEEALGGPWLQLTEEQVHALDSASA